ncbi:MAG: type II toxin-antitoxin system Phd/YefM family antitoxin [Chloroflexota bacterium]|nr:type II toxin-antitoxin system Phd/YefM family antitoxin [Chloroflexota bacterium]
MRTVGSNEAKTHLPSLLDEVSKGGVTIVITKHGVPVARLIPPDSAAHPDLDEIIKASHDFRQGKTLGELSIRDLIETGRRD